MIDIWSNKDAWLSAQKQFTASEKGWEKLSVWSKHRGEISGQDMTRRVGLSKPQVDKQKVSVTWYVQRLAAAQSAS